MATTAEPEPDTGDPADSPMRRLAEEQLADPDALWTVGEGTAAATFARHPDEHVSRGPHSAVTSGRAIRLTLPADAVAIAYETPDPADPLRWQHAVVFCLPAAGARRAGRTVITELGPDTGALRPQDTAGTLFDLGRGGPDTESLVRTSDPAVLAVLREVQGRPADELGGAQAAALAGPAVHRVVRSAAGRIEVFGPTARRAVPPHPPTAPIPEGWVPCLTVRPPHPAMDQRGRPMPFDHGRHERFQAILVEHGDPVLGVLKADVVAAVRAMRGPAGALATDDPIGRATVAVAVRQLALTDGTSGALAAWRSRFGAA